MAEGRGAVILTERVSTPLLAGSNQPRSAPTRNGATDAIVAPRRRGLKEAHERRLEPKWPTTTTPVAKEGWALLQSE